MFPYLDAAGNAPPIPAAAQNRAIINGPYFGINAAITNKHFNQVFLLVYKIHGNYQKKQH